MECQLKVKFCISFPNPTCLSFCCIIIQAKVFNNIIWLWTTMQFTCDVKQKNLNENWWNNGLAMDKWTKTTKNNVGKKSLKVKVGKA